MRILLTFVGFHDPFNPDDFIAGRATDGPVLTTLSEEAFDRAYLFADQRVRENAQKLLTEIGQRYTATPTEIVDISFSDPTDYDEILSELRRETVTLLKRHESDDPRYFVATASGTPQIQTVWFLLARSGLLPATLLKITPRRYLRRPGDRCVSEVRLSLDLIRIAPSDVDTLDLASLRIRKEKLEAERETEFREIEAEGIVGDSKAIRRALATLLRAAPFDYTIILLGEPGTGKELFAKLAHRRSPRRAQPFIIVNCPAIPSTLIESEFFGIERGVATGVVARPGKFELAHGGTLFLDEVGDLSPEAQAALLRVLQEKDVQRVGASKTIPVDVRIIAATNKDLPALVKHGSFRQDLYARLNVISVQLPPLRDRREDLESLIRHFLGRLPASAGGRKKLSRRVLARLLDYHWPDNVRQLDHVLRRIALLADGNVIEEHDLPPELVAHQPVDGQRHMRGSIPPGGMNLTEELTALERAYFTEAIASGKGNYGKAAGLLGIKPNTFRKRAKALGL